MKFTSAEEAWESFKKEYFGENSDLAEGFSDDNPLTGSASYEIYLYDINDQEPVVQYLEGLSGVPEGQLFQQRGSGAFQLQ